MRSKALKYLQDQNLTPIKEKQLEEIQFQPQRSLDFLPYSQERSYLGKLLFDSSIANLKTQESCPSMEKSIARSKQKISLVVKPGAHGTMVKGKHLHYFMNGLQQKMIQPAKFLQSDQSHNHLQTTFSKENFVTKEAMIQQAENFKKVMKAKTFNALLERKIRHDSPKLLKTLNSESNVGDSVYLNWKMNSIDKSEYQSILKKLIPKAKKLERRKKNQMSQELPGIGTYDPNWKAQAKSEVSIIISKSKRVDIFEKKHFYKERDIEVEKDNLLIKCYSIFRKKNYNNEFQLMYGHMMSQIDKEVRKSINQAQDLEHPYNNLSCKPLDRGFVEQLKSRLNEKFQESTNAKKRILLSIGKAS